MWAQMMVYRRNIGGVSRVCAVVILGLGVLLWHEGNSSWGEAPLSANFESGLSEDTLHCARPLGKDSGFTRLVWLNIRLT